MRLLLSTAILYFSILFPVSLKAVDTAPFIVLTSGESPEVNQIIGDETLLKEPLSPASTFKIVLSWAALELGIVEPETRHFVKDKHVPHSPVEVTLKEAMYHSSNDYFVWLAKEMGNDQLHTYVLKSKFFPVDPPAGWEGRVPFDVVHAGKLVTNVNQQHWFIRRVMNGTLTSTPIIQRKLTDTMEWPAEPEAIDVYGKTGAWAGAVWFNGFGRIGPEWKAVTVLIKGNYTQDRRQKAIRLFYKQFGLDGEGKLLPESK